MADLFVGGRLRQGLQNEKLAISGEIENDSTDQTGVLNGANDVQSALNRLDGTGVGAPIFRFTGSYTAQNSNISEWFGGRQLTRLRCTDNGGLSPVVFTLPGSTALGTAFDQLVTAGLPEVIRFVIEYIGPSTTFLNIVPRPSSTPVIMDRSNIRVNSGIAATVEVTRENGTISDYIFTSIGGIAQPGSGDFDSIKLINPATATWDASDTANLPSSNVVKGNAYQIRNVPSGSGEVLDEFMQDEDYAVWNAETFTSWSATPHQWFVLSAHDVRRISALEDNFLSTVVESPESDRNTVVRGTNYADSAGEIRIKLYTQQSDYSASDLNTTGDIDEFTDASDADAYVAIRLTGTHSTLESVLPTLYLYSEDSSGNFTRLLNLHDDFAFQGDFASESDYLSNNIINYTANDTLRIYVGTIVDRYNSPELDISEQNLTADVQAKLNRSDPSGSNDQARLASLETKMNALYPLTPDVTDLTGWADIYNTENATQSVNITTGYSLIADYRGASTRYESAGVTYDDTGTNVVTYTGLGDNYLRGFGFKVDSPADQVLMWIVDGSDRIPFVDMVDTAGTGTFRINNYTPATTEDRSVVGEAGLPLTASGASQTTLRAATADTATYTMRNYPTNATSTSRTMQLGIDVLLNGSDTEAEHLQSIDIPDTNISQSPQNFDASIYLGPLHNNRTVNVTMSYETRVSGSDMLVDVKLVSAPSDVTIRLNNVFTILNYTAPATIARVDNFVTLGDGAGDYEFTGETELLLTFHPFEDLGITNVVPVAVTGGTTDQLNDVNAPFDAEQHFGSVEIPDQTALSGFEFRTFAPEHYLTHSDLAHLLSRRTTQWCYALAELRNATEHAVTEEVDFTQGIVLISPNSTRYKLTVDNNGTLKTEVVT